MPTVSIIIPVFNEEKRIEKCISSIQNQTFRDLEIIAVNDGSTDRSPELLNQMVKLDSRIKVLNLENGGTGFALNKGIQSAMGKYIGFSGADDWIETNMFANLISTIENENADVAVCDIMKEGEVSYKCLHFQVFENQSENLLKDFIFFKFDFSVCNKLYKRDIILKFRINFDKELKISQDVLFNLKIFATIKKISLRPEAFYHYVSKPGSLMTRPQSQRIESFNYIIKAFNEFCKKNNLQNEWLVFTENIGRGYQQYFLNLVLNSAETRPMNFITYYKHVLTNLRLMDPLLLRVPDTLSGYQKFRMGLLKMRTFRLFSLLTAIRHKTIFRDAIRVHNNACL